MNGAIDVHCSSCTVDGISYRNEAVAAFAAVSAKPSRIDLLTNSARDALQWAVLLRQMGCTCDIRHYRWAQGVQGWVRYDWEKGEIK